jgi:hypothetical protein
MATIPTLDGQTARLQPIQTSPLPREAFGGGAEIRETAKIYSDFEQKNTEINSLREKTESMLGADSDFEANEFAAKSADPKEADKFVSNTNTIYKSRLANIKDPFARMEAELSLGMAAQNSASRIKTDAFNRNVEYQTANMYTALGRYEEKFLKSDNPRQAEMYRTLANQAVDEAVKSGIKKDTEGFKMKEAHKLWDYSRAEVMVRQNPDAYRAIVDSYEGKFSEEQKLELGKVAKDVKNFQDTEKDWEQITNFRNLYDMGKQKDPSFTRDLIKEARDNQRLGLEGGISESEAKLLEDEFFEKVSVNSSVSRDNLALLDAKLSDLGSNPKYEDVKKLLEEARATELTGDDLGKFETRAYAPLKKPSSWLGKLGLPWMKSPSSVYLDAYTKAKEKGAGETEADQAGNEAVVSRELEAAQAKPKGYNPSVQDWINDAKNNGASAEDIKNKLMQNGNNINWYTF